MDKTKPGRGNRVQTGLDQLISNTPEFGNIMNQVLGECRGVETDIHRCLRTAYHHVAKVAHGNTGFLTFYHENHEVAEIAAMVIFLRIQEKWPKALQWREVKRGRGKAEAPKVAATQVEERK